MRRSSPIDRYQVARVEPEHRDNTKRRIESDLNPSLDTGRRRALSEILHEFRNVFAENPKRPPQTLLEHLIITGNTSNDPAELRLHGNARSTDKTRKCSALEYADLPFLLGAAA